MNLLTKKVKDMIGEEKTYLANEEIGYASIRYFSLAIGDNNKLYSNNEFAKQTKWHEIIAPPTYIFETNQYMSKEINEEGYLGHTWDIPLDMEYSIIRGGNEYNLYSPLLPSTLLEVNWKIIDIFEKQSKNTKFLIVTSLIQYFDQNQKLLAKNHEDMIYMPNTRSNE
jgi:hypothetical protein